MNNDNQNTSFPVKLISGAYSSWLWDNIYDWCENAESPENIYEVIKTLHECNKSKAAFSLVKVLYDMLGSDMSNDIMEICENDNNCSLYIAELLSDIENMI